MTPTFALAAFALFFGSSPDVTHDRIQTLTSVNLRSCPQTVVGGCNPLATLPSGTELELGDRRHREWFYVTVLRTGTRGWVHSQYVTRPVAFDAELAQRAVIHARALTALTYSLAIGFIYVLAAVIAGAWRQPRTAVQYLLFDWRAACSWVLLFVGAAIGIVGFTRAGNPWAHDYTFVFYAKTAAVWGYGAWALWWGIPAYAILWCKVVWRFAAWLPITFIGVLISLLPAGIIAVLLSLFGGGIYYFVKRWRAKTTARDEERASVTAQQSQSIQPAASPETARYALALQESQHVPDNASRTSG